MQEREGLIIDHVYSCTSRNLVAHIPQLSPPSSIAVGRRCVQLAVRVVRVCEYHTRAVACGDACRLTQGQRVARVARGSDDGGGACARPGYVTNPARCICKTGTVVTCSRAVR